MSAKLLLLSLLTCACVPIAEEVDSDVPSLAHDLFSDADLQAAGLSGCPTEMVLIPKLGGAFCIDRYEAAVVQILPDGSEVPWSFDRPVDGLTVKAISSVGRKPQAYISGTQAAAACLRAGKRLCKEPEWEFACRGPSSKVYPYGNTYQKGACNEGRATNPVNDCFGSGSSVFNYKNMNSPCCVSKPNTVTVAGAFTRCQSDFAVYDLHGNLHEWVDAKTPAGNGVFRGGFFVDAKINGAGCGYRTSAHAASYHDYSTGFRCCAEPR